MFPVTLLTPAVTLFRVMPRAVEDLRWRGGARGLDRASQTFNKHEGRCESGRFGRGGGKRSRSSDRRGARLSTSFGLGVEPSVPPSLYRRFASVHWWTLHEVPASAFSCSFSAPQPLRALKFDFAFPVDSRPPPQDQSSLNTNFEGLLCAVCTTPPTMGLEASRDGGIRPAAASRRRRRA